MSLSLNPIRFVLVCIFLTPIVNNINGFMMYKFGVSALGPMFYSGLLLVVCLSLLSLRFERKVLLNNYLLLFAIFAWYGAHSLMYGGWLIWFRLYIKFFLPFLLYRFLHLYYAEDRESVLRFLGATMYVWASMAILTAVFNINPSVGGEGHYGFIDGNNDYVAMLFALFPVLRIWKSPTQKVMYLVAVVLTRSKGLLALGVMLFFRQKSKLIKIFALIALAVTVSYYMAYFHRIYKSTPASIELVASFLSFGRFHFLGILWDHVGEKPWLDYVIGSGFGGGEIYTEGKMGIEMDLVDTLNLFGVLGFVVVVFFYYRKVFSLSSLSRAEKADFLPLFLYSILGGHLLFNPVSNVVFVLVLVILEDKTMVARLRNGPGLPEAVAIGP